MPFVDIESSSGPLHVSYHISTPSNPSAETIDESLPTLVFLHGLYLGQQTFEFQFRDKQLRRFNLVSLDTRGHGDTRGPVPKTWSPVAAAEDLFCFMQALNLPPCHFVSMCMHTLTCAHLNLAYPDRVLSHFLISPVPDLEDKSVLAGRQEIYDCWVQAYADPENVDQFAAEDSIFGALQYAFNNIESRFITALVKSSVAQGAVTWSDLDDCWNIFIGFFANSTRFTREQLCKNRGSPVLVVHGQIDIAYPIELAQGVVNALVDAGVQTEFVDVPKATHYACVTAPNEINELLHNWILRHIDGPPPPIPTAAISPWESLFGDYEKSSDEESD